jgi:hypothetical protein
LGILTIDEQEFIYKSTREIIERIGPPSTHATLLTDVAASAARTISETITVNVDKIRILAWPARDEGDAIALLMLQQTLDPMRYEMEISAAGKRLSEILQEVEQKTPGLFCVGFIPPGGLSASRHVSKLLRPAPRTYHCGGPLGIARESSERPRSPPGRRRHPCCRHPHRNPQPDRPSHASSRQTQPDYGWGTPRGQFLTWNDLKEG